MKNFVVVNEKYIAQYYEKKAQLNRLKDEVDEMSKVIKNSLIEHKSPMGKTYGEYKVYLHSKVKLNDNFILMLKNSGMQDRITEVCYMKDCSDLVSAFTKEEKEVYLEEWYKQLFVTKKK